MKTYCYIRVSTDKQDYSRQEFILRNKGYIDGDNCTYIEETGSGKNLTKRVILSDLLDNVLQEGDTLVAVDLTRISRSIIDFRNVMDYLLYKKKVNLVLLKENFYFNTGEKMDAMTKAMLNLIGVFAEFERDVISDRIREKMAEVKVNGSKSGKPIGRAKSKKNNKDLFIKTVKMVIDGSSLREACNSTLFPLGSFTRYIKKYKTDLKTNNYEDIYNAVNEGRIEYGV